MYTEEQQQILIQATKLYGALEQCGMAQEESAELIQAINKLRRLGGITSGGIQVPHPASSKEYALAYNNLCGEVAVLEIILHQMRSMLRGEQIDLIKARKITRLQARLEKNTSKP